MTEPIDLRSTEEMRAEFEAWFPGPSLERSHESGEYLDALAYGAWLAWQEAMRRCADAVETVRLIERGRNVHIRRWSMGGWTVQRFDDDRMTPAGFADGDILLDCLHEVTGGQK